MAFGDEGSILGIAAYGAARATPFLETRTVEDVLAEDRKETSRFVHAFKADGASGKFDKRGCWRRDGFRGAGNDV